MKNFAVIVLLVILSMVSGQIFKGLNRLDRLNIDNLLGHKRVVANYVRCFCDQGPCTLEGREIKQAVPQFMGADQPVALTPTQREKIQKVLDHIQSNYPAEYDLLKKKYDPKDVADAKLQKATKLK